jgi:hypothetical protein
MGASLCKKTSPETKIDEKLVTNDENSNKSQRNYRRSRKSVHSIYGSRLLPRIRNQKS